VGFPSEKAHPTHFTGYPYLETVARCPFLDRRATVSVPEGAMVPAIALATREFYLNLEHSDLDIVQPE